MVEIRHIETEDLHGWWQYIRPGLERCKNKSGETWIPEDVYGNILFKRALLWVYLENDKVVGFTVGLPEGESFHIWCAWAEQPLRLAEYLEKMVEVVKEANYSKLTFSSNRPGWNKVGYKLGFRPKIWVKEL